MAMTSQDRLLVQEIRDYMIRLYRDAINLNERGYLDSATVVVLEKLSNCVLLRSVQAEFAKLRKPVPPSSVAEDDTSLNEGWPTATREATRFIEYIDSLLVDDYEWARDTLEGIRETVESTQRVTEAQQRAVENIDEGGQRGRYRH